MGVRRVKYVGEFAHEHCDLGAHCWACGRVAVYCDWEIVAYFRLRGWNTSLEAARARFSCKRCGSREIELIAIPIFKRPKPVPDLPPPVQPIYMENYRRLRERGWLEPAQRDRFREVLALLHRACDPYNKEATQTPEIRAALDWLRPHVYRKDYIDDLWEALRPDRNEVSGGQAIRQDYEGLLRQLGMWPEVGTAPPKGWPLVCPE